MTLSPALAQAMASARPALNATVAAARGARPGFDTGALGAAVRDRLDPVVAAVASVAPERVEAVAVAGFGMIVALIGQRLIGPGARDGAVDRLWTDVAPAYAGLIAASPASILGGLTNAATRIAGDAGSARRRLVGGDAPAGAAGRCRYAEAGRTGRRVARGHGALPRRCPARRRHAAGTARAGGGGRNRALGRCPRPAGRRTAGGRPVPDRTGSPVRRISRGWAGHSPNRRCWPPAPTVFSSVRVRITGC